MFISLSGCLQLGHTKEPTTTPPWTYRPLIKSSSGILLTLQYTGGGVFFFFYPQIHSWGILVVLEYTEIGQKLPMCRRHSPTTLNTRSAPTPSLNSWRRSLDALNLPGK